MPLFVTVFIVVSAVILAIHAALAVGVIASMRAERRMNRGPAAGAEAGRPEVVVAVRDEEETLPLLLASLRAQTRDDVLFLFVDDRSTDGTGRLLDEFLTQVGERARVLHNTTVPSGLTGKQAALDQAFDSVRGDVLLFTDGDCLVPPTWAEEMMAHFVDPRVGVVLGRVELPESAHLLGSFQAFEQPLLNQYNFGSVGIGTPTGCFGNNMAIRTRAVKAAGGFRVLGYSVTEDAMLLDAVARREGWKVRACTSARAAIRTRAQHSWAAFVEQHTRWNAGALFSTDVVTRFSYTFIVLFYLVGSIVVMPLGFLDWRVPVISMNAFLSIGILAFLGGLYEGKQRAGYYLLLLPYLLCFGFFYSFVTVRAALRRRLRWKGAALRPAIRVRREGARSRPD